jgi:hypothetical protein
MAVEVSRVLKDGFYSVDREIINHVKTNYNLEHKGSGIESGIRILIFTMPLLNNMTVNDWLSKFDDDLTKVFPDEKFT